ncbi:MAG: hypothetical protein GF328_05290 [Candidatus Latescibacteria bacterium]|nr:hypothetical protein [Candidatus Latescibacterota bacterium]
MTASIILGLEGEWAPERGRSHATPPIVDSFEMVVPSEGVSVPLPEGIEAKVHLSAKRALVWPIYWRAQPGADLIIKTEPLADLSLTTVSKTLAESVEIIPDLDSVGGNDPAKIDSILRAVHNERWTVTIEPGAVLVQNVPRIPFHVFGVLDRRGFYLKAWRSTKVPEGRGERTDALGGALQRLSPPPGTLVAPGRLNTLVLGRVLAGSGICSTFRNCTVVTGNGDLRALAKELPECGEYTVWNNSTGVAYLTRKPGGFDVVRQPGSIIVESSRRLEPSEVGVWPALSGTGAFFSRPFWDFISYMGIEEDERVVLCGLPIGEYFIQVAGGTVGQRARVITLTCSEPSATYRSEHSSSGK